MRWRTYTPPPNGTRERFFAWLPEDSSDGHTYWLTWLFGSRHAVGGHFGDSTVHLDPRKDS